MRNAHTHAKENNQKKSTQHLNAECELLNGEWRILLKQQNN